MTVGHIEDNESPGEIELAVNINRVIDLVEKLSKKFLGVVPQVVVVFRENLYRFVELALEFLELVVHVVKSGLWVRTTNRESGKADS